MKRKLLPHVFREREQKNFGYFVIKLRPRPTYNELFVGLTIVAAVECAKHGEVNVN